MTADAGARLQSVLAELRRLPGILGVTIARRDWILIAHSIPKRMDPKKIATLAATIVGTSEIAAMASIQLAQGRDVRAILESDHGKLLSLGAGEEALLVALVYDDANLGLVLMALERAAKQVERILQDAGNG